MDDWLWDTLSNESKRAFILFTVLDKKPSTVRADTLIEYTDEIYTYIKNGGAIADVVQIKSVKK